MENLDKEKLLKFLQSLDIDVKNINYYITAFAHSSYVNENKDNELFKTSYDRLEFLGDSVLGLLSSNYLYEKPESFSAGEMSFYRSKVIRKEFLAHMSDTIGLTDFILLGKGNINKAISKSIREDIFEAFLGAMFKDQGLVRVKKFLDKWFFVEVDQVDLHALKDYKTKLQEFLQSEKRKPVNYRLLREERKSNNKTYFEINAEIDGVSFGKGSGWSKKEAEQNAAKMAFEKVAQ